jgi:hypothetical protein
MNKRKEKPQEKQEESYIELKSNNRDAFQAKKETKERAHNRRKQLRELREDHDWN